MSFDKVNFALIGCGFWGPNFLRVIQNSDAALLTKVCDTNISRLKPLISKHPGIVFTQNLKDIANDPNIEAVVVCTPADTHFEITKELLLHGKHVLCEKPLASAASECDELHHISLEQNRQLLTGHVFEYNSIIRHIKNLIAAGAIGEVLYMQFNRMGLGPSRTDADVVFDLASHDVSLAMSLLGQEPLTIAATGSYFVNKDFADVAFIQMEFAGKVFANINVSWIDPVKERMIKIVGSKKMILFDDISPNAKLKVIEMGAWFRLHSTANGGAQFPVKDGEIVMPGIETAEPLIAEFNHFIACIWGEEQPLTGPAYATRVVRVLEGIEESIEQGGTKISLTSKSIY